MMRFINEKFIFIKLCLGLTATPDRMDNKDIYELFDKNVPYELNLRDAISNELVVPFHYYGIRNEYLDYNEKEQKSISNQIVKEINASFIKSQIEKHRVPGKLKAIAFCTQIAHAENMAKALKHEGYKTCAVTGNNNYGERIKAFEDLQSDEEDLEIICTVDVLNEGVDIPAINMVLFLRPTDSQTIFLQQLGRGLRKYPNKEFLTVLDFIGNNYDRSVKIALALGSLSKSTYLEKKYLIDLITNDFSSISLPNVSIFFDDLSKIELINYLEKTNFNRSKFLEKDYENFKNYLKCQTYPKHIDYLESDVAPNLIRFMKSSFKNKNKSYYNFLKNIGEKTIPYFNDEQVLLIDSISELLPIVRLDEFLILKAILNNEFTSLDMLVDNKKVDNSSLNHAMKNLKNLNIINNNNKLNANINAELHDYLIDLFDYAIGSYEENYGNFEGKFKILQNYYKEQVMLILQEKSLMYMKGTKFYPNGETYIFVGLKKGERKKDIDYKDCFLNSKTFQWESENNTILESETGKKIKNTKIVHIFIRKMDSEDGITLPFTYFGTGKFINIVEGINNTSTGPKNTLICEISLEHEVPEELFLEFGVPEK